MLPYYAIYPEMPPMEALLRYNTILQLLFLGCIASTICFLVWNWVIRRLGAIVTTNYVYFNPVVTILCAWVVLNERITGWFLLGTVMILTGMYLADRKQKTSHNA